MAAVSNWLKDLGLLLKESSDPRTKDWPFMENPLPLIIISVCYLYFVCKAGPQFMKDKKPYNLKTSITIYNSFQILSCLYLIYGMLSSSTFSFFVCEEHPMNSKAHTIPKLVWWTFMLKLTEYIETVFFVLRKKQEQVSGLHLYHHVSTLSFAWLTSKFAPSTVAVPPIVINSFIHILMYSYYLIALHGGKEIQKKIVIWKRSLTILQMVQFTIIIAYLLTGIKCSNQFLLLYLMLVNVAIIYFLFYKFYKNTYKKIKAE